MSRRRSRILAYNPDLDAILVVRRSHEAWVPYPDYLDLIGGNLLLGEDPEQGLRRIIQKDIKMHTGEPFPVARVYPFKTFQDCHGNEYSLFFAPICVEIMDLRFCNEPREFRWLTREMTGKTLLAFGLNKVVQDFFAKTIPDNFVRLLAD